MKLRKVLMVFQGTLHPLGCLVSVVGPQVGPAILEPGQRLPQLP